MSPELRWLGVDLRLREPAGEPDGVVVLNHGRGADENDLFGLLEAIDPERRLLGVTTGAPFAGIGAGGRHWYLVERVGHPHPATFGRSYAALGERLDELLAERGIGWSRTLLGGFSQGTAMSYALALGAGRPVPAGILANSGFIPEAEGWEADLESRRGLPAYIHHGVADRVIPVDFARAASARLQAAGIEPIYRETPAGHWLPPAAIEDLSRFVAVVLPPAGVSAPRDDG